MMLITPHCHNTCCNLLCISTPHTAQPPDVHVCVCVCVYVCVLYVHTVGGGGEGECSLYHVHTVHGRRPPGGRQAGGRAGERAGGGGLESAGTRVHGVRTVDSNVQQEVGEQD